MRLVWRRFRDMQVCASPPGERFARCAGASVGSSGRNRDGAFFSSRRKEHPCRRVSTKSLAYPSDRGASGKGQDGKDEKRTILQRRRMRTRHTGVIVRQGTPETRLVWRHLQDMQVCASPPGERFARCAGASVGSSGRNRDGAFFSSRRKEHPCRRVSTKSLGYPSDRGASGKGQDGKDEKRTILQRRRMCTRHTGVIVRCRVHWRRDLCGGISRTCKLARLRPRSGL